MHKAIYVRFVARQPFTVQYIKRCIGYLQGGTKAVNNRKYELVIRTRI